jgi:hypothetical protein
MKKRCVIQPWRQIHQLSTVATFACRWVMDTMGTCFVLLIYHWWWIWWWINPTFETENTHSYHTGKEEFVDRPTRVHQSIERIYNCPAPTRKKLVNVKLYNIHTCKILLFTLL